MAHYSMSTCRHTLGVSPEGIRVVPMGLGRYGEGFERRKDPRGRTYYWMTYNPRSISKGPKPTSPASAKAISPSPRFTST